MQWKNFLRILRENADLELMIRYHVGSPALVSASLNHSKKIASVMLKEHVEKKLAWVAFRDATSLDPTDHNSHERRRLDSPKGTGSLSVYVTYSMCFQIVGEEAVGARLAYVDDMKIRHELDDDEPDLTIQAVLKSRIAWYEKYWAKQGKSIRFNAVFRKERTWTQDDQGEQLVRETLDIWRLPEDRFTIPPQIPIA